MEGILRGGALLISAVILVSNSSSTQPAPTNSPPPQAVTASNSVEKTVRPRPVPPLDSFLINPGIRIELAASETLVNTPVAMAFDENRRLFVVEWPGSAAPELRNRPGRIRLLEDTDGDGVFDASTVYADNLPGPSGISCYDGGVFVTAGTEIVFLKDTRADGIADSRKVVFSGFGSGTATRPPPEARLTSLAWGLDNRIHGGTAGLGGVVSTPGGSTTEQVSLVDSDYAFDPRTGALLAEAGPSQAGVAFNSRGERFVSDFARPLRKESYELRYAARNPFFPNHEVLLPVANPATAVFHWAGTGPHRPGTTLSSAVRPREISGPTNLLAAAWLTNAHGALIYRGTALPTEYQENLFIACPDLGIVHREVLRDNGLDTTATRAADERMSEFLIGKEASFHPVQIISGPEGALYVADAGQNAQSGHIYRITAVQFRAPKLPTLTRASTRDLVATLAHPDGWQRDTAARLLYQRRDPGAPYLLTNMLRSARLPIARLQALHVLDGLDALSEGVLAQALTDRDETVRQHAIRLCEKLVVDGNLPDGIWTQLRDMTADPSLRVRYQLAFTLGEIKRLDRAQAFLELLTQGLGNQRMQTAILSSLATGAAELLALVGGDGRFWTAAPTSTPVFPEQVAGIIGLAGDATEQQQTLDYLDRTALEHEQSFRLLFALSDGLRRARKSLAGVDQGDRLQRFHALARVANLSGGVSDSTRAAAIRFRGVSPYATLATDDFLALIIAGQSEAVQSAALEALSRYENPTLPTRLAERWPDLAPNLRNQALAICLARDSNLPALLTEIENGRIGTRDLDATQVKYLRLHPDPAIRDRAGRVFGNEAGRAGLYERFKVALRGGIASRGQPLFADRCAKCHQKGGDGQGLGPDLAAARLRGKEQLLNAILYPGLDIEPGYTTQIITTTSGENLIGSKANETAASVTVRQANGVEFVLSHAYVASIQPQPWSLMPDGLEQDLSPGQMADLLEYLMTGSK